MICCIPTKSRPTTKTYQLFEKVGIPVYHFIEPSQMNDYAIPNKIPIQQNNQGIAYVRNFILQWAKQHNHQWIIMCDDDVTEFGIAVNNKCVSKGADIWFDLKSKAEKLPFEIYGLNYRQHAWHETKPYSINKSFIEVCVLMNTKKIKWEYRKEYNLKEDRDFVLQTIKNGNGVVKFHKHYYNTPAVGGQGGLYDEYKAKKDEESARKMCYEWSPFITLKQRGGRIDINTDIKGLAAQYNKVVK